MRLGAERAGSGRCSCVAGRIRLDKNECGLGCSPAVLDVLVRLLARRDVYEMRRRLGPDAVITGAGGVTTWSDAVSMIMCGADLVGICTATIVHGFGFMPELIRRFKEYMRSKGYEHPGTSAGRSFPR